MDQVRVIVALLASDSMHAFFNARQHVVMAIWWDDCVVLSVLFFLSAACIQWTGHCIANGLPLSTLME